MTFIFVLMVGAGSLLIISALENVSIAQTIKDILAGKSPTGKPSSGGAASGGGGSGGSF